MRNYDANSQMPTGRHNGRSIFYVFGRYPADLEPYPDHGGGRRYPVIDLVMCHGSFLNADHEYVHKNKSVKGFGTYGDVLIRDRKMYVAPTPFALTEGTTGLMTLIVPEATTAPDGFERSAASLAPKPPSLSSPTGSTCARTISRPNAYAIRGRTPSTASSRTGSTATRPSG